MDLKFNNTKVSSPKSFSVTIIDLDDGNTTVRTADGMLHRDRIAVKRQIEISWPAMNQSDTATILQAMSNLFFEVYYPDPQEGTYVTKTFYVGNRPCPVAIEKDGVLMWDELKVALTEK